MFASLSGLVERCGDGSVVVDVNGVGYLVRCPAPVAAEACGKSSRLFIETIVREDSITLYGFLSDMQREWFRVLVTVQSIGAKTAVAVLSRSEEHKSELQSLMRISYAVFCLKKKKKNTKNSRTRKSN